LQFYTAVLAAAADAAAAATATAAAAANDKEDSANVQRNNRRGMAVYMGRDVSKLKNKGGKWKYVVPLFFLS
jgi:opacity protein-like surface antigen